MFFSIAAAVALLWGVCADSTRPPGGDIQVDVTYELASKGPFGSTLYNVVANSIYDNAVQLIDLTAGSSFNMGYDMGFMMGDLCVENYQSVLVYLLGEDQPGLYRLMNTFLDHQWDNYMSAQVPEEYMAEIDGMTAGGIAGGTSTRYPDVEVGKTASRSTVIANFPGSLENLKFIFEDEKKNPVATPLGMSAAELRLLLGALDKKWRGLSCSMFGVWGNRTQHGYLFTGRNLDWFPDLGISKHKLITVHHPPNGYAHATVGWAGIWGSITGLSSQGVSVHEANLESNDISFRGFPWVLRHRHIMAYAANLDEAISLWNATNNTVGFNHAIGSKADRQSICLETMYKNTAVFGANDPREQYLMYEGEQIGNPRENAVYRTNHGYDDYTVEHFMWNGTGSYKYSIARYQLFPELFDEYAEAGTEITVEEAINITAIVADKGDDHLYDCLPPHDEADNILSVTFDTENVVLYAAWENGSGDQYTPAACNTYLKFDVKIFF